jgi:F-type H+-transporting ATPase subunit b
MLEINHTLFIQMGNFLLLLFLLNVLLFRPIRRILAQRNEEMESLERMIEDYQSRADENEKGIEENMVLARKEGLGEKEDLRNEGQKQEQGILQEANAGLEEKMGKARKEMERKMAEVRKALQDQTAAFSMELAEKILGRSIQ